MLSLSSVLRMDAKEEDSSFPSPGMTKRGVSIKEGGKEERGKKRLRKEEKKREVGIRRENDREKQRKKKEEREKG